METNSLIIFIFQNTVRQLVSVFIQLQKYNFFRCKSSLQRTFSESLVGYGSLRLMVFIPFIFQTPSLISSPYSPRRWSVLQPYDKDTPSSKVSKSPCTPLLSGPVVSDNLLSPIPIFRSRRCSSQHISSFLEVDIQLILLAPPDGGHDLHTLE